MNTKQVSLKDPTTEKLYKIRLNIFENTRESYRLQKNLFRLTIIDANMKRIHLEDMIMQVDRLITLQRDQISNVYSAEKEKEINTLSQKINGGDWTVDEKNILASRRNDITCLQIQIAKKLRKIDSDGTLLVNYQGTEIIGLFEDNDTDDTCRF